MLLQTNSYIVPKDKRTEHERLIRKFRQTLLRLGCESFEIYEQAADSNTDAGTRCVQLMRFRDKAHQHAVQEAEHRDATAQAIVREFCELINFPYQLQQGLFATSFYNSISTPTYDEMAASTNTGGASSPATSADAAPDAP